MNNKINSSEKSGIIHETFFILDNDCLKQVNSHLYGYYADKTHAFVNCSLPEGFRPEQDAVGAYVALIREGTEIKIYQDSSNQFYLFIYEDKNYFCISNNFYMMCEHLQRSGKSLSLNKTYANQLISTSMSPVTLRNTLAREISVIPMFCDVTINCETYKVDIQENEVHFDCVDVDSKEGMDLLDSWISRYASFINAALGRHKYCGRIDLSGGYDSRTIFSIAYASGIDLNSSNIHVYSKTPQNRGESIHHNGDLETAQKIADLLGFRLNQHETIGKKTVISGKFAYEVYKNSFEGFHRQAYLENFVYQEPYFHLGGFGGEPVRGTYQGRKKWFWLINRNPVKHIPEVYAELMKDLDYLSERSTDDYEMFRKLFLGGWGRNHFGLTAVRDLMLGRFVISAFFDLDIYKLKFPEGISKDAVFALTIQRTCPQLLSIPYADGSDFSVKTKEYVRYLCDKYGSKFINFGDRLDLSAFSGLDVLPHDQNDLKQNGPEYLYEIFRTQRSRDLFLSEFGPFGEDIYNYADACYKNPQRFAYTEYCGAIAAVMEFLRIVYDSQLDETITGIKEIKEKYPEVEGLKGILREWEAFKTARIDIKVIGNSQSKADINFISDPSAEITQPDWFTSAEGIGTVIESTSGDLQVSFTCNSDGELQVKLRGIDLRDKDNNRIPSMIRFRKMTVNDELIFDTVKNLWHDKIFTYSKSVKKGDIFDISLQFEPGGE